MANQKSEQSELARRSLDRRALPLRKLDLAVPNGGWIKAVREALGMTMRQMGKRMGVVPSRIFQIEVAEPSGSITIRAMRDAAAAMDCTFVYAVVPNRSLDEILQKRAAKLVKRKIARHHQTMTLENQALDPEDLDFEQQRLVRELLQGPLSVLWDEK